MANTALNRSLIGLLTNKSGGSVAQGDVVIVDAANAAAFTTTTTSSYSGGSIGVVLEPNGIASNAVGLIAFGGYVPMINLSSSASLGDLFHTHSVAKQAIRHAAPAVAGDFGQVWGTGTSPAAFLWGQPSVAAGAGSTTLAGDSDVSLSGLANFDSLQYQTGDSKFHNIKGGAYKFYDTTQVGSVASITVSSIPAGYSRMEIFVDARGDVAATQANLQLQFNGDTGANYDISAVLGNNAASTSDSVGSTSASMGWVSGATSPANVSAQTHYIIHNYDGTTFQKNFLMEASLQQNQSTQAGQFIMVGSGHWRSTSAITSFVLTPASGNFVAGTRVTVYLYP